MTLRLLLYEDRHWRDLRPLTDLLPVPALAFGASDLARRWLAATGAGLLGIEARRGALAAWSGAPVTSGAAGADDEVLVVNAAALPGQWLESALAGRAPALWMADGRVAGARLPFHALAPCLGRGEEFETSLLGLGLPAFPAEPATLRRPWDLIAHNPAALASDLANQPAERAGEVHPQAVLLAPERISVAAGARVDPLAVLDARPGPIRIESGAIRSRDWTEANT